MNATPRMSVEHPAIRVGVAAAVRDDAGRLLLVERTDSQFWCLPGGQLEFGESISECAQRECAEEVGLEVEVKTLRGIFSDPTIHVFELAGGAFVHWVTAVVDCVALAGEPRADGIETRTVGFFAGDQLPKVVPSHRSWIVDAFEVERSACVA